MIIWIKMSPGWSKPRWSSGFKCHPDDQKPRWSCRFKCHPDDEKPRWSSGFKCHPRWSSLQAHTSNLQILARCLLLYLVRYFDQGILQATNIYTWVMMYMHTSFEYFQSEPAPTNASSTGCLLWLSCGWTSSTELIFGFTLVTHLVRSRSYI